jgi:hypothetical protein
VAFLTFAFDFRGANGLACRVCTVRALAGPGEIVTSEVTVGAGDVAD